MTTGSPPHRFLRDSPAPGPVDTATVSLFLHSLRLQPLSARRESLYYPPSKA